VWLTWQAADRRIKSISIETFMAKFSQFHPGQQPQALQLQEPMGRLAAGKGFADVNNFRVNLAAVPEDIA